MKICFYPGCSFATSAGYKESTEAVCRKLDIELHEIPDWNCCGATVMFGENKLRATALAARHFALVQTMGFDDLVTGCNACYATLRKAARLLTEDQELFQKTQEVLQNLGLELDRIPKVRHLLEVLMEAMPDSASDKYKTLAVGAYYGCQLTRPYSGPGQRGLSGNPGTLSLPHRLFRHGAFGQDPVLRRFPCGDLQKRMPGVKPPDHPGDRQQGRRGDYHRLPLMPVQPGPGPDPNNNEPRLPVTYFTQLAGLALGLAPAELGLNKLLVSADKVLTRP